MLIVHLFKRKMDLKEIRSKKAYIAWEDNEINSSLDSENEEHTHLSLMTSHHSDDKNQKVSNNKPSYDELQNTFNELHDKCLKLSRLCTK